MKKLLLIVAAVALFASAYADNLRVAGGAGYKPLVEDWANLFESKTGKKVERMYGNMGQVTAQLKLGGGICAVIGENSFLRNSGINFASFNPIGKGVLVIATRKGLKISSPADLKKPEFAKIAIPDVQNAIYGKAGAQLIKGMGIEKEIDSRLIPAGTVPRAGAYILTGEADAAFVNLTFADNNKDKIGSYILVEKGYSPLEITAAVLPECSSNKELQSFLNMLNTPDMKKIVKQNGL